MNAKKNSFKLSWWMYFLLWGFSYLISGLFNATTDVGRDLESLFNIMSVAFLILGFVEIYKKLKKR